MMDAAADTACKLQPPFTDSNPAREIERKTLYANVEALLPGIAARIDQTRERRSLPEETVQELKESGYFRVLQPKKYGGFELLPQDFCALDMKIAESCMSTGWVCGVIGVHPFQLALFDERAQQEVWNDDPDCLMSSSYAPMGKIETAKDGFRFSGRWGWSSGCDHCEWALLGGIIPGEGYRTFLVPRKDYEIVDTWHVMGLQGTGSKDIVVKDAFVPEYRTHKQMDGFALTNPGNAVHDAPIFSIPWGQIFVRAVSTPPIGALKTMLKLFTEGAQSKASSDPAKLAADPHTQAVISRTANTIDEMEAVLYRNFGQMMECTENGREIPLEDRVRARYQAALVVDKCLEATNRMFASAGGRSVFLDSRIQQWFLDIRVSRAHVANNPTAFERNYGGVQLGVENNDLFV